MICRFPRCLKLTVSSISLSSAIPFNLITLFGEFLCMNRIHCICICRNKTCSVILMHHITCCPCGFTGFCKKLIWKAIITVVSIQFDVCLWHFLTNTITSESMGSRTGGVQLMLPCCTQVNQWIFEITEEWGWFSAGQQQLQHANGFDITVYNDMSP